MRNFIFATFLFLITFRVHGQEAQNIADLDFLYQSIQALPSYKDQLKKDKSYHQLYESLRKDLNTNDEFEVYQKLLKLIYPIKDNHLGFYRNPDSSYRFNYLRPKFDLAGSENKYSNYPKDSIEGMYYNANGSIKYAIYAHAENVYYIQSMSSGVVEVILTKTNSGNYDAIRFSNPPVPYILFRNIRFKDGYFIGLPYQKDTAKNYAFLKIDTANYAYKKLDKNIGYLRLSSFSSTDKNIQKATDFFNQTKASINDKFLIVDLRNNNGGGYKNSKQFLTFLKKFKGKIYLLQNGYTISNAEQFIIQLKDRKNVTTIGETTNGKITYGSNYGNELTLPSERFLFYPTDMKGSKKELAFESTGVEPKVSLDPFTEDWIVQTMKYIQAN